MRRDCWSDRQICWGVGGYWIPCHCGGRGGILILLTQLDEDQWLWESLPLLLLVLKGFFIAVWSENCLDVGCAFNLTRSCCCMRGESQAGLVSACGHKPGSWCQSSVESSGWSVNNLSNLIITSNQATTMSKISFKDDFSVRSPPQCVRL